jgi:hypothetical protein
MGQTVAVAYGLQSVAQEIFGGYKAFFEVDDALGAAESDDCILAMLAGNIRRCSR